MGEISSKCIKMVELKYYVDGKGRIRMWNKDALYPLLHDKYFNKNDKWLSNKYFKVVEDFVKEVLENE